MRAVLFEGTVTQTSHAGQFATGATAEADGGQAVLAGHLDGGDDIGAIARGANAHQDITRLRQALPAGKDAFIAIIVADGGDG